MQLNFGKVVDLPEEEQQQLDELKYIYDYHRTANRKKRRYYNGKITLNEVNLGIALPSGLGKDRLCLGRQGSRCLGGKIHVRWICNRKWRQFRQHE